MNQMLLMLMLTGGLGNIAGALTGSSSTGSSMSSLLPLMLLSGRGSNQMTTLGLLTGNTTLMLMGAMQPKRSYRRRTKVIYRRY